jgi:peptidoglycan/xylan/chitin deacetylase (PgdA/CDA1 family)
MKRRILSLSLAVIMVAVLVPMITANANIPAQNRGIGFVYMYSASANTTAAEAWNGGFNQINGPFIEFDVTQNGTYVLELPPWPRSDSFWIVDNTRVHFLSPASPSGTALPVVVEQIRIGTSDRLTSAQNFTAGDFWSNTAGTYFGNIALAGETTISSIPGYNIRQYSVGGIPATVKLGPGEWDPSAGASTTMGTISQGAVVRITFRVGAGGPVVRHGHVRNASDITAADVTLLRGYVAAQDKAAYRTANPSFNLANADVNGDGFVNSADITLLRRYVAATNKTSVPLGPAPQPLSGTVSIPSAATVGVALTANTSGLNSQTGLTYQWQRTGTGTDTNYTNISGATSASYTPVSGDVGRMIRVQVSSPNGGPITSNGTSRAVTAALGGTPSIPSTATVGIQLSVDTSGLTPAGIGGLTYQWQRSGTADTTFANISGATSSTYTPATGDANRHIRVRVSSNNATGTRDSNQTARVAASGGGGTKVVAVTFDDGPNVTYTPQVLDFFNGLNVRPSVTNGSIARAHVTFYIVGDVFWGPRAQMDLVMRMVNEGHAVDAHSWSHPHMGGLSTAAARTEMRDITGRILHATGGTGGTGALINWGGPEFRDYVRGDNITGGRRPWSFRPPYFDHGPSLVGLDREFRQPFIFAGVDPDDWRSEHTAQMMANFILNGNDGNGRGPCNCAAWQCSIGGARNPAGNGAYTGARGNSNTGADGANILFHDGGGSRTRTIETLPLFVTQMQGIGYEFTTVQQAYARKGTHPCWYTGARVNDWIRPAGTPGGCNHTPRCAPVP